MIVTLTARCQALLKKVVKLKTYMLILNCCINVLSHRNRFEYRTTVFIEYFWRCIQKNEALAVHLKTQNRSRQLSYLPFSRLFQMSCQETYWCHTLIEQKQSPRKLLKKTLTKEIRRTSILIKFDLMSD